MKTVKALKIYRALFADSLEEVDFQNFGCHFSICPNAAEEIVNKGGTSLDYKGDNLYVFSAWVDIDDIDLEATVFSNEEHPNEYEIVVFEGTDLTLEDEDDEYPANTGNRVHDWVKGNLAVGEDSTWEALSAEWQEWVDWK